MKYRCEFVGGWLNGYKVPREWVEEIATGHTPYRDRERARGGFGPRRELDGQPTVKGYLGPMWDGTRYEVDGKLKSDWELTEEEKAGKEPIAILRYETQEVYNMLSN